MLLHDVIKGNFFINFTVSKIIFKGILSQIKNTTTLHIIGSVIHLV